MMKTKLLVVLFHCRMYLCAARRTVYPIMYNTLILIRLMLDQENQ
jgi:hypothetical protein